MFDEAEETDNGERARLPVSPSPPLTVCLPGGSPSSPQPLELFSSACPLLGDTDPPYLATPECLHLSAEKLGHGDSPHYSPPKFCWRTGDTDSPFSSRQEVRIDDLYDRHDPLPKWRGRGAANAERLQHRGQRQHGAPELSDHGNHSTELIDTGFNSDTRQM
ncbi:hypothetical protein KUCAC02_004415 [Chaenocephalus aceratus]|uniref:Uncharacterized protein n=1 Tax=Chaenocephalus aceratus TaxID=36190 RepID=A0ACB9WYI8_CHAAC|nr:hypothetical protein KUCAC02_004415 [Chaenocephalus aceratus]